MALADGRDGTRLSSSAPENEENQCGRSETDMKSSMPKIAAGLLVGLLIVACAAVIPASAGGGGRFR